MKFKESAIAHKYLDGLKGLEIGGAAHNPFGLDTLNVDRFHPDSDEFKPYRDEQMRLCGEVMPVDIVAPGNNIPVDDKSFDFVISSHVLEHFFDPIGAMLEWKRIAREYIGVIIPHRDALESDREKPITPLQELIDRHEGRIPAVDTDEHHTRWEPGTFADMCAHVGLRIVEYRLRDDKVGNGHLFILKVDE